MNERYISALLLTLAACGPAPVPSPEPPREAAPPPPACAADADCDDGNPCTWDRCNERCMHEPAPAGTTCGGAGDACRLADTCNGEGACLSRFLPNGTPCGDPHGDACDAPDACLQGVCMAYLAPAGAPCGDPAASMCNAADACDGAGACLAGVAQDGASCEDCPSGDCGGCGGGLCENHGERCEDAVRLFPGSEVHRFVLADYDNDYAWPANVCGDHPLVGTTAERVFRLAAEDLTPLPWPELTVTVHAGARDLSWIASSSCALDACALLPRDTDIDDDAAHFAVTFEPGEGLLLFAEGPGPEVVAEVDFDCSACERRREFGHTEARNDWVDCRRPCAPDDEFCRQVCGIFFTSRRNEVDRLADACLEYPSCQP